MSMYGSIGFTRQKTRVERPLSVDDRKRVDVLLDRYTAVCADDDLDWDEGNKILEAISDEIETIHENHDRKR